MTLALTKQARLNPAMKGPNHNNLLTFQETGQGIDPLIESKIALCL